MYWKLVHCYRKAPGAVEANCMLTSNIAHLLAQGLCRTRRTLSAHIRWSGATEQYHQIEHHINDVFISLLSVNEGHL